MKLSELECGVLVQIDEIEQSPISAKLVEMGLYVGQHVKVLFKAPFGDPIAVSVGGYVLSLRLNEAMYVTVNPCVE